MIPAPFHGRFTPAWSPSAAKTGGSQSRRYRSARRGPPDRGGDRPVTGVEGEHGRRRGRVVFLTVRVLGLDAAAGLNRGNRTGCDMASTALRGSGVRAVRVRAVLYVICSTIVLAITDFPLGAVLLGGLLVLTRVYKPSANSALHLTVPISVLLYAHYWLAIEHDDRTMNKGHWRHRILHTWTYGQVAYLLTYRRPSRRRAVAGPPSTRTDS